MMTFPIRLLALAALLGLAGCASVVPQTAARLQAMNLLTADPAQITVAVVLPQGLQVPPGSATMIVEVQHGQATRSQSFVLVPRPTSGVEAPEGAAVLGFGLSDRDAEQLRALQTEVAQDGSGPATGGSISVGLNACLTGAGLPPDASGAVLIRLARDEAFSPLIRPTPLARILGKQGLAAIQPCDGAR